VLKRQQFPFQVAHHFYSILHFGHRASTLASVTIAQRTSAPGSATKDAHNRRKGLKRLEKQIKSGRLTKSSINNRGYNKYLKLTGEVHVEIDYEKFERDAKWDGLKGYITNSGKDKEQLVANYKELWQIEKAFKIFKSDLKLRPIYHRLPRRIHAHICISFVAYVYKELERCLK